MMTQSDISGFIVDIITLTRDRESAGGGGGGGKGQGDDWLPTCHFKSRPQETLPPGGLRPA